MLELTGAHLIQRNHPVLGSEGEGIDFEEGLRATVWCTGRKAGGGRHGGSRRSDEKRGQELERPYI